ncbi:MAG TPA: alcohol dehydrogenase catalytic domain-containing protein [Candidatus Baltobacteraceae bacterium]|jgi:L-iditol 2-dehydrogenase|nr:alcohol dehydrogenase catalytic domain-containing protein [Candidatus Baltobacteraceae bacterium]
MSEQTMRAAVLYDVDDIRIERRAIPPLRSGDLLVRMVASGVCSGDIMPWYVRRKAPIVFGHEPAGEIVAIDGDAYDAQGRPFVVGERVFVHHHAPCGVCRACSRSDAVQCATWRATALDPGGMAEFFRVPKANLLDTLRLPSTMETLDGSLIEPLACVVKSLARGFGISPSSIGDGSVRLDGQTLAVVGLGVMGLLHVLLGRALGARIIGSDPLFRRRELAVELGASAAFSPEDFVSRMAEEGGADVVICGPGNAAALQQSIAAVCGGGTVVMFTPLEPSERFSFDQSAAFFSDLRLVASYSCGPEETRAALARIADGTVTARRLQASIFPLERVADAYTAMREFRIHKAIVSFSIE